MQIFRKHWNITNTSIVLIAVVCDPHLRIYRLHITKVSSCISWKRADVKRSTASNLLILDWRVNTYRRMLVTFNCW